MIALEVWLLAAVAIASPATGKADEAPPVELLEFIGEWSAEEQELIKQAAKPAKKPAKPRSREADESDENDDAPVRSGPPR